MRRLVLAAALAAGLCASLVPPAHAGVPFTVGEGKQPHLIVDAAGTAHVVWIDGPSRLVNYCQVPRGATACATEPEQLPSGTEPDAAFLVEGPGALYIAMPHYVDDKTYLWRSFDDGATWGPRSTIYGFGEVANATEPVYGPQTGQITFAGWNPTSAVWSAATNGSEAGRTARTELPSGEGGFWTQVAPTEDGGLVATGDDRANSAYWRLPPASDPSDLGSWSGQTPIGPGQDTRLAGGLGGTYMLSGVIGRQRIRRWNDTSFTPPVSVESETGYINDITVSPAGGVGAIWRTNGNPHRLRMALSTDNGERFTSTTIAREDSVMADMDLALGGDDKGFAVWEGVTGAALGTNLIRLADTEPVEAVSPNPPSIKVKRARVKGATLRLTAPGECIPPGARFSVRLAARKRRMKNNPFVRLRRTDFFIGARLMREDKKAPYAQRIRIRNAKAGKTYTLRVKAYIKQTNDALPKKTIRTTIRVCAA